MPPATSPQTALNAIIPLINAGDAYSAHQKARTFASRYSKSKSYDAAIEVLFQSACELLKAGQAGSGSDLASMLIKVYEEKGEPLNEQSRGRLTQLIALTGTDGTWRETVISNSVAWSSKASGCPAGDPDLQYYIGEMFYKESSFPQAESHLISSGTRDAAKLLAQLLFEWSRAGSDPGAYASRGVVPWLLTTNILAARTFLDKYMSLLVVAQPELLIHKDPVAIGETGEPDEIWATNNHTLNFLQLAVRICQRLDPENPAGTLLAKNAWVRLCGRYAGGVTASASGSKMLLIGGDAMKDVIISLSDLYFNIKPPRTGNANPLADMMAAMMGGGPPSGNAGARKAIGAGRGRGGGGTPGLD